MSKLLRCCATYLKGARLPHETRTCRQPRFSLVAPRPGIRVNPQRRFACRGGYTRTETRAQGIASKLIGVDGPPAKTISRCGWRRRWSNGSRDSCNRIRAHRVARGASSVSYTHLRAHETKANLVCRLLLEKKKIKKNKNTKKRKQTN